MYRHMILSILLAAFVGCGENSNTPLAGDIEAVAVEANATSFYATQQLQMTATASYTNGIASSDVTESINWKESNGSIASVDALGLVSGGEFGGDVEITGSYKQYGGSVVLHVFALESAVIETDETNLTQEQTLQLRVQGTFDDGAVLDVTDSMFWVLDPGDSNASIDQNGTLYTGDANGTLEINATRYDVNATLQVTVTP